MADPRPVPHSALPLVLHARFTVRCGACGFGADSAEREPMDALADVMLRHDVTHARTMTITPAAYHDHPLYRGVYAHEDVKRLAPLPHDAAALDAALSRKGDRRA